MTDDQPDLVRRLLGEDAPDDAHETTAGPERRITPAAGTGEGPRIEVEPDDPDYVPQPAAGRRASPEPPSRLRRFAPSVWPWPAATPQAQARNVAVVALAVLGAFAGLFLAWYHLTTDPLADVRPYFDAAVRLNHGQPLYPSATGLKVAPAYALPPLLAVALRPVALLG
ncbi:MAG TPA: hypothetical protein VIU37_13450, partial [Candidatus Limnocylindrales bacterium]